MFARLKRWWERRRRAAFDRRSGIVPRLGIWQALDDQREFLNTLWTIGEEVLGEKPVAKDFELRGWPPVRRVPRYPRPPAPPVDHPAYAEWLKTLPTKKTCYDSDRS